MKTPLLLIPLALALAIATPAMAGNVAITGDVAQIEMTYMPDRIEFTFQQGQGGFCAGKVLVWRAPQNLNAVYSALLANTLSPGSSNIMAFYDEADVSSISPNHCLLRYIYITQ